MADLSESSKIWPQMNHLFNEQIIRVDSSSVPCQTLSWGLKHVMVKLQDRVFMLCPRFRWTSWGMGRPKTLKWDSGSSAPEPSRLSVPEHSLNIYYVLHLWPGSENKKTNQTQVWFFWRLSQRPFQTQLLILLFSCVDSLWPDELEHARLPCPSPSPGACSNPCPLSQSCHPTISPSVVPLSSLYILK